MLAFDKIKAEGFLKGQITPRKYRTPFVKILLFCLKIPGNPFVLGKISHAICKSEFFQIKLFLLQETDAHVVTTCHFLEP